MSIFSHMDHCHVLEQNMAYFTVNFIAGVKTKVMGFTQLSQLIYKLEQQILLIRKPSKLCSQEKS